MYLRSMRANFLEIFWVLNLLLAVDYANQNIDYADHILKLDYAEETCQNLIMQITIMHLQM